MSVVFICQNLMYGNEKLCNSRVNSQYHLLFINIADFRNMYTISDNRKIKHAVFNNVLANVNHVPYGYLLFDNCTNSFGDARVRTNIFPGENAIIHDV